ncbi:MAG TPA: AGE family epimerase/isomerase [Verrucomicrobiota bacterium]|nr:AGE family epimerase/isomerase [Verrucomicrobiota bacterium]HNU51745.1 AGE family epimerase/isomerase [Verrucomicrobiota bacterium]
MLRLLPGPHAADLAARAVDFKRQLEDRVLPYWYDTTVDWQWGGYRLADDAARKVPPATEKQVVSQARMVWGFAHAHLHGYRDPRRDYLKAARQGYEFLIHRFLDRERGGYFWKTDLEGNPVNDRKYLYGEAFVVYALVEYHRASGDPQALAHAMDLYRLLQQAAHDPKHGGWGEHFERDWTLIHQQDARIEVERAGLKSANAHLHWMEALAELFEVSRDPAVRRSLAEALRVNQQWFYPRKAGNAQFHRKPDWGRVEDPQSAGLSYGHNVEFAWLMVRAQQVLGRKPAWRHFDAILDHALQFGTDHERGGLYNRGYDDRPATDTAKVWWAQAEMMAALNDRLRHQYTPPLEATLDRLVQFLVDHQIQAADGIWLDTVAADGRPVSTSKAHLWKANYHDLRALVKFIQAFHPDSPHRIATPPPRRGAR